mmetsp:Transcript_42552/g.97552  ORF Transcript_42552/g.97552 Transcript_42552/m.97552 type:complete len:432 (-) Transcript_42552:104-1399(-)
MGNATAVDVSTSSLFALIGGGSDVDVSLRLVDHRNVTLPGGLELTAYVPYGSNGRIACCSKGSIPACFQARPGTPVMIEFHATRGASERQKVSEVRLPLEHIAAKCGRGLYRTWFPLSMPRGEVADGSAASFERAIQVCSKEVKAPMVCLSLCQEQAGEGGDGEYTRAASDAEKAGRFDGLLLSHTQHVRMVMSLYNLSREEQQVRARNRNRLDDSRMVPEGLGRPRPDEDDMLANSKSSWAHSDISDDRAAEGLRRLQLEVEATTGDANKRINDVSARIRTLKERVNKQLLDNSNLKRQTAEMNEEAEALELENERLALQLERRAKVSAQSDEKRAQLEAMRKDVAILRDQKDSLVLILEDLYSSASKSDASSKAGAAQSDPYTASGSDALSATTPVAIMPSATSTRPKDEGFTNMLPRPSELFSSDRFD